MAGVIYAYIVYIYCHYICLDMLFLYIVIFAPEYLALYLLDSYILVLSSVPEYVE